MDAEDKSFLVLDGERLKLESFSIDHNFNFGDYYSQLYPIESLPTELTIECEMTNVYMDFDFKALLIFWKTPIHKRTLLPEMASPNNRPSWVMGINQTIFWNPDSFVFLMDEDG